MVVVLAALGLRAAPGKVVVGNSTIGLGFEMGLSTQPRPTTR
jgi:hypothetical protein